MKKSILLFSALALASFAYGDWLYWTVTESEANAFSTAVDSIRIGYVTTGQDAGISGTTFAWSYETDLSDAINMKNDEVFPSKGESSAMMVNLGEISGNLASYSFYVELLNSSGEVIGRTKSSNNQYVTYTDLTGFITTAAIADVPSASIWHGGTFEAVPEPSSMALLALGAGLVGLRRKLKKGKKEKRA